MGATMNGPNRRFFTVPRLSLRTIDDRAHDTAVHRILQSVSEMERLDAIDCARAQEQAAAGLSIRETLFDELRDLLLLSSER
jgi:hypothetical protein